MAACVADAGIIFLPCGFFFFLSSFFPRLISVVAEWMSTILCTWCGLSADLECMSEMCCLRLLEIQDAKMTQKIAIWAPSHNFVRLNLHNLGVYGQSEKNLLNSNISSTSPQYGELWPTSG